MADFGAHLNKEAQSSARPSVFDLLAQESLLSTLRPAFSFSIRTLASRYPERFASLHCYTDEIYSCLLALVEKHFLWTKNASFSEHFYDLKRVNSSRTYEQFSNKLTQTQRIGSLAFLTVIPYIKTKMDRLYSSIKEETVLNESVSTRSLQRWKYIFINSYPYLHCLSEGSKLAAMICYVIKLIDFHSVSNWLLGVLVTYSDLSDKIPAARPLKNTTKYGVMLLLSKIVGIFSLLTSYAVEYGLPSGIFFLRFIEWWYSSDSSPHKDVGSLPIPPPPEESKVSPSGIDIPAHPSQCPLCSNTHRNPTVLSPSGFVFCYTCIYKYVETHHRCPLTLLQCDLDDLVKLYF